MVPIHKTLADKLEANHPSAYISRSDSAATTSSSQENSPYASMENSPKHQRSSKQGLSLRNHKPISRSQRGSKASNTVSKINSSKVPQLLEKYRERSSQYRDEEFTQQACSFLAKIASDEEIPNDIKGNFSLYYILVSIAKIFMLNEYELTILACALDHCEWNVDDIVSEDEEDFLKEFPCSLEVEITKDSRRLIIYLLVLAFNLKSNLNPKDDLELIQVYCEKICKNFSDLLKRSSKSFLGQKLTFSHTEINLKFKELSKKDNKEPFMKILKDYNMVVESILRLTGSHTVKPKVKIPQHNNHKSDEKSKISEDIYSGESNIDTDMFYADFNNDLDASKLSQLNLDFSRQASAYKTDSFINVKREPDFELFQEEDQKEDENNKNKKIKVNEEMFSFLEQPELTNHGSLGGFMEAPKRFEGEDILDMVNFSRATSNQIQDDIPLFARFDSNFSLFGGNKI